MQKGSYRGFGLIYQIEILIQWANVIVCMINLTQKVQDTVSYANLTI